MAAAGVRVWAPVAYEGPARALVRALKFRGAWAAAEAMAAQIVANAPENIFSEGRRPWPRARGRCLEPHRFEKAATSGEAWVLVPVPLHPRRLRRRGYDQAALLARALAERTGLATARCLERGGSAGAQVGRGRADRLAGPPGEIRVATAVPPRVLLVDDVVTTGGTLAACAAALRGAGAREVAAVAYARTPGR